VRKIAWHLLTIQPSEYCFISILSFNFYLHLEKHRQQTLIKGFKKEKEKSSRVSNIPQVFPWYCTEGAGASDKSNFAWHISAIVLPCLISLA
jgi:hypothetical protein